MTKQLSYKVSDKLIQEAIENFSFLDFKTTFNQPTGNFFYDPWEIKPEFKDSVWDKILSTLPELVGEARIINLKYGVCYQSHADIDDRYHLNLQGDMAYLINLNDDSMHRVINDGFWYELDTSSRHSAANFGYLERIQIVVRKLLIRNNPKNSINVKIKSRSDNIFKNRYLFDNHVSGILNIYNKNNIISNFCPTENEVKFNIDSEHLSDLESHLPEDLYIERI